MFGHHRVLKNFPNRVSFEQYPAITVDRHLLIKRQVCNDIDQCLLVNFIGLQGCRSKRIAHFNRFARVSIDTYCPNNRFATVSIDTYCSIK